MGNYATTNIFINLDSKELTDANGYSIYKPVVRLFAGDHVLITATVIRDNGELCSFPNGEWRFALDDNFTGAKVIRVNSNEFNNLRRDGWADPSKGKISWLINLDNAKVYSYLADAANKVIHATLWFKANGESYKTVIANFDAKIVNTVRPFADSSSEDSQSSDSSEIIYFSTSSESSSSLSSASSASSHSSASSESSSSDSSSSLSSEVQTRLLEYEFTASNPYPTYSDSNVAGTRLLGSNFSFVYTSGLSQGYTDTTGVYSNLFTELEATRYFYFELSPTSDREVHIQRLAFATKTNDPVFQNVKWRVDVTTDGYTWYAYDQGALGAINTWEQKYVVIDDQTKNVGFRIYFWGLSSSSYSIWLDRIRCNGETFDMSTSSSSLSSDSSESTPSSLSSTSSDEETAISRWRINNAYWLANSETHDGTFASAIEPDTVSGMVNIASTGHGDTKCVAFQRPEATATHYVAWYVQATGGGNALNLTRVLAWLRTNETSPTVAQWRLDTSPDNSTWTTRGSGNLTTTNTWERVDVETITHDASICYFRLYLWGNTGGGKGIYIDDISVHGQVYYYSSSSDSSGSSASSLSTDSSSESSSNSDESSSTDILHGVGFRVLGDGKTFNGDYIKATGLGEIGKWEKVGDPQIFLYYHSGDGWYAHDFVNSRTYPGTSGDPNSPQGYYSDGLGFDDGNIVN